MLYRKCMVNNIFVYNILYKAVNWKHIIGHCNKYIAIREILSRWVFLRQQMTCTYTMYVYDNHFKCLKYVDTPIISFGYVQCNSDFDWLKRFEYTSIQWIGSSSLAMAIATPLATLISNWFLAFFVEIEK